MYYRNPGEVSVRQSEEVAQVAVVEETETQAPSPSQVPDPLAEGLAPADWAAADEMRRRTFSVGDQGYDQEEVRAYLTHLAEVFAHLCDEMTLAVETKLDQGAR